MGIPVVLNIIVNMTMSRNMVRERKKDWERKRGGGSNLVRKNT